MYFDRRLIAREQAQPALHRSGGDHYFDDLGKYEPVEPEADSLRQGMGHGVKPADATCEEQNLTGDGRECCACKRLLATLEKAAGESRNKGVGDQVSARWAEQMRDSDGWAWTEDRHA